LIILFVGLFSPIGGCGRTGLVIPLNWFCSPFSQLYADLPSFTPTLSPLSSWLWLLDLILFSKNRKWSGEAWTSSFSEMVEVSAQHTVQRVTASNVLTSFNVASLQSIFRPLLISVDMKGCIHSPLLVETYLLTSHLTTWLMEAINRTTEKVLERRMEISPIRMNEEEVGGRERENGVGMAAKVVIFSKAVVSSKM
jgi:hypothetical protein